MTALQNVCDAYISLHRAEGFGLGMAESMYLGKPVIATNYSGNTDFTMPSNVCLVDCDLIPVKPGDYAYYEEGQVWAEPNIEQAAQYMRRLFADRKYAQELGQLAQKFIRQNHNYKTVGDRYNRRLKEISVDLQPNKKFNWPREFII
jgi:glycosyltransferase involved in cell wall biosynthesis